MIARYVAALAACAGCAASYQSARVLPVGKTEITAALGRVQGTTEGSTGHVYVGDVQVRHGIDPKFDVGFRLMRTPGAGQGTSLLGADAKYQITHAGAKTVASIGVPFGLLIQDTGSNLDNRGLVLLPTFFVGTELSPKVELVIAPKLVITLPEGGTSQVDLAASIGLRFHDPAHTLAVHPELSIYQLDGNGMSSTFFGFGVGISAAH